MKQLLSNNQPHKTIVPLSEKITFVIYKSNSKKSQSKSSVKVLACSSASFKQSKMIDTNITVLDCINAISKTAALDIYFLTLETQINVDYRKW